MRALVDGAYLPRDVAVSFATTLGDTFAATLDMLREGPFPDARSPPAHTNGGNRLLELATASLRAAHPPPVILLRTARQHLRRCIDGTAEDTGGIATEDAVALMAFFDRLPAATPCTTPPTANPDRRRRRRSVAHDSDETAAAATHTPLHDMPVLLAAASPSEREQRIEDEASPPSADKALAAPAAASLACVRFPLDVNPKMARFVFAALIGAPVVEELDALTDKAHRVFTVASAGHEAVVGKRPPVTQSNLRERPLALRHGRVEFLVALGALGFSPRMQLAMLYASPCPEARGQLTYGLVTDSGDPANSGVIGGGTPAVVPPPGHFGVPAFSVPPPAQTPPAADGVLSSDTVTAVFGPFVRGGVHAWTITGQHVEYLAIGVVSTAFTPARHKDFTKVPGCANLFMSGELHSNFGPVHAAQRTEALFGSKCAIVLTIHYGHMLVTWSQAHDGTVLAITPFDGRELAPAVTLRYQSTVRWAYTPWLAAPISTPAVAPAAPGAMELGAGARSGSQHAEGAQREQIRRGRRRGPTPPPGAPGQPNPQPGFGANAPDAMLMFGGFAPFGVIGAPPPGPQQGDDG